MLSRVAEALFWMSRYIERAESVARFIDVNINLVLDLAQESAAQWEPLVNTTGDHLAFKEQYGTASRENVIRFLAFDRENPNSIVSCLCAARENARCIREAISSDMWEQLNTLYLQVNQQVQPPMALGELEGFFAEIKRGAHMFRGVTDATMSRNEGWHFYRMGQMLERADKTARILDVKYFMLLPSVTDIGSPVDDIQWSAVLRSCSGLQMYRKCWRRILPERIVEFLALDREFPRAMHYCVIKADESLHAISGTPVGTFHNPAEQRLGQLRAELSYANVQDIMLEGLHEFLDSFESKLNRVGEGIFKTFFALRPVGETV
ncbi:MAG: alpha-E domain-containing protein [Gammaproteobacteria bacterium]|nr:alpha-E domain-containing protein [Gammaproteobacteria bacterium]